MDQTVHGSVPTVPMDWTVNTDVVVILMTVIMLSVVLKVSV